MRCLLLFSSILLIFLVKLHAEDVYRFKTMGKEKNTNVILEEIEANSKSNKTEKFLKGIEEMRKKDAVKKTVSNTVSKMVNRVAQQVGKPKTN